MPAQRGNAVGDFFDIAVLVQYAQRQVDADPAYTLCVQCLQRLGGLVTCDDRNTASLRAKLGQPRQHGAVVGTIG